MTETTILDDSAVSEIEAQLEATGPGGELSVEQMRLMVSFEANQREYVRALCAAVKHLRDREKRYAKVLHDRLREMNALGDSFDKVEEERDNLSNAVSKVWDALGITEYTGKHISEHVADLQSQLEQLRAENEALRIEIKEKERGDFDWKQSRP